MKDLTPISRAWFLACKFDRKVGLPLLKELKVAMSNSWTLYWLAHAEIRCMRCAAPLANGVHLGKLGRNGKHSGSCNSSGLLSHHIRGGVPEANGNGYSSRHSSELSVDEDWEPRPPSSSNFSKVSLSLLRSVCQFNGVSVAGFLTARLQLLQCSSSTGSHSKL